MVGRGSYLVGESLSEVIFIFVDPRAVVNEQCVDREGLGQHEVSNVVPSDTEIF